MDWKSIVLYKQTESLLREIAEKNMKKHIIIRVFVAKIFIETKVATMKLQGFNL